MTTNDPTTTCSECGEDINLHTGKYLVCADGIREFESITERRKFERSAYLNLADEFDPMGDAPGAEPLAFVEADWDASAVHAARAYATRNALPLPWEVRSMDNAMAYVAEVDRRGDGFVPSMFGDTPDKRAYRAAYEGECDGFAGANAWGACAKCGALLGDHSPTA